jgi:hypothetical protein
MATTYTLISSVTVGSGGAANITFSSIPSTYTDLCLVTSARSNVAGTYGTGFYLEYNGSGGTAYDTRALEGYSSTAASYTTAGFSALNLGGVVGTSQTANTFNSTQVYIPNYAGSNNKSASIDNVQENNSTTAWDHNLSAGLWSNTAAITQIKLTANTGSFVQYTTAYLYGISSS